ncbi:asparagine synthetase B family protein, partial [Petrachloros mirabilis]
DSSALVSVIHHHGQGSLCTFSIGFEDSALDEGEFQRELLEHLGADHHRVLCTGADVARHFIDTIWHTEAPIIRTAPVPMRILSGFVREHGYRVVLTGEGADEVLGGYDIFKEAKIRHFWAKNPESKIRPLLLRRLYPYLELSRGRETAYLKHFFGIAIGQPDKLLFSHLPRWTTTAKCKEFYSEEMRAVLQEDVLEIMAKALPDSYKNWHSFNRAQYLEAKVLMAGYLLCSQGDRMLMSNSVEGRFPFLDHRVIEFANSIHPKLKMKALKEKYLLKRAMGSYLPKSIVKRTKQPYRGPGVRSLLGVGTPDYVEELLGKDALRRAGYFDPEKVARLWAKVKRGGAIGEKDNMAITSILSTQVWHHLFVDKFGNYFGTGRANNEHHIKQYA